MFFDRVEKDDRFVFSISSVIGIGKSTLTKRLATTGVLSELLKTKSNKKINVVYVEEPVALWKEKGWLQEYYANPDKNALAFQLCVMDTHVKAVARAFEPFRNRTGEIVICVVERCPWDQLLFWDMQVDGKFSSADSFGNDAYTTNWSNLSSLIPETNLIFFAKTTSFDTTQQRLKIREPNNESLYEYNARLYEKHNEWYTTPVSAKANIPCVHLLLDNSFHTNDNDLLEIAKQMAGEINKLI